MNGPGLRATQVRRRHLTALLAASGTVVLGAACSSGPRPVPTSADIALDPLAELDPDAWDAREAEELLSLPVDGAAGDFNAWAGLDLEDEDLPAVRRELIDFLATAYFDPERLRDLDHDEALEHVLATTPGYWKEGLETSWAEDRRHFYAIDLAEPFRVIGTPAAAANWFRGQDDATPTLMLGGTVAWSVLDSESHDVGVIAYRFGITALLDDVGTVGQATYRVTVNGLDMCLTEDNDGLVVPAISDSNPHRRAQEATERLILGTPRITRGQLEDTESAVFGTQDSTIAVCD